MGKVRDWWLQAREHESVKVANDLRLLFWVISTGSALVAAAITIMRSEPLFVILLACLAAWGLTSLVIQGATVFRKGGKYRKRLLIPIAGLVIVLCGWWWHSRIAVYPPFRKAWEDNQSSIGLPTSGMKSFDSEFSSAYQARFQRGIHIWTQKKFYFLFDNNQTYRERTDLSYDDSRYQDLKWLASHFPNTPQGFGPPDGSLAYLFDSEPENWNFEIIGGMEWTCAGVRNVHYQEFKNATIIGVLLAGINTDKDGQIFILYKEPKHWEAFKSNPSDKPNLIDATCHSTRQ